MRLCSSANCLSFSLFWRISSLSIYFYCFSYISASYAFLISSLVRFPYCPWNLFCANGISVSFLGDILVSSYLFLIYSAGLAVCGLCCDFTLLMYDIYGLISAFAPSLACLALIAVVADFGL